MCALLFAVDMTGRFHYRSWFYLNRHFTFSLPFLYPIDLDFLVRIPHIPPPPLIINYIVYKKRSNTSYILV